VNAPRLDVATALAEPAPVVRAALAAEQLQHCLPHRYPYLLVDCIEAYEPGQWIRGVKNIASWEPMLVPPGIKEYPVGLVIESIGQIAIALFNLSRTDRVPPDILLGSLNDVVIAQPVPLGCRLELYAEVGRELDNGFIFSGAASLNGRCVLSLGSLIAIERP
jgi:3-hydroxyacyl-[acyl-carrier-protein] dehydratase